MFCWILCQAGAEPTLKAEIARLEPEWRPAFSRPGFVSFKAPAELAEGLELRSVFAREYGLSIGKLDFREESWAAKLRESALAAGFDPETVRPNFLERDISLPGEEPESYEPGARARALAEKVREAFPQAFPPRKERLRSGERVLDLVALEPDEAWIGFHLHSELHSPFPGAMPELSLPVNAPSRAYLKAEEAIALFELPLRAGDIAVEIGSAPGGASRALLDRGLRVAGVDPARMDPEIQKNPDFRWIPKAASQLEREDLPEKAQWLLLDIHAEPVVALRESLPVARAYRDTLLGVLLTLKLNRWELAEQIPSWIEKVRGWGMSKVRAKQLRSNRREICVYGLSPKGLIRARSKS